MTLMLRTGLLALLLTAAPLASAAIPLPTKADGTPSLAPMLKNVTPAVVNVLTRGTQQARHPFFNDPNFREFFGDRVPDREVRGLGSGVIVDAKEGLVLTNAAGWLRPEWPPGSLMRVTDHLNLQGRSPLTRDESGRGLPYDLGFGVALASAAEDATVELRAGVYAGLSGPSYETPAEIRMLARFGADAVGMSTVAEALAGHAEGLRVAAVSCITNHAAGITGEKLDHAEVIEVGRQASERFCGLLEAAVPRLAAALSASPPSPRA